MDIDLKKVCITLPIDEVLKGSFITSFCSLSVTYRINPSFSLLYEFQLGTVRRPKSGTLFLTRKEWGFWSGRLKLLHVKRVMFLITWVSIRTVERLIKESNFILAQKLFFLQNRTLTRSVVVLSCLLLVCPLCGVPEWSPLSVNTIIYI